MEASKISVSPAYIKITFGHAASHIKDSVLYHLLNSLLQTSLILLCFLTIYLLSFEWIPNFCLADKVNIITPMLPVQKA